LEILELDHFVLTTADLAQCLHFYTQVLKLRHEENAGRHSLYFGKQKINIHTRPGEFLPAAANPAPGALDFCLVAKGDIDEIKNELCRAGAKIVCGVVPRNGAQGKMDSVYVRDPDGNLVEIAVYR